MLRWGGAAGASIRGLPRKFINFNTKISEINLLLLLSLLSLLSLTYVQERHPQVLPPLVVSRRIPSTSKLIVADVETDLRLLPASPLRNIYYNSILKLNALLQIHINC